MIKKIKVILNALFSKAIVSKLISHVFDLIEELLESKGYDIIRTREPNVSSGALINLFDKAIASKNLEDFVGSKEAKSTLGYEILKYEPDKSA
jgi:phenylalanyl-tRNA synthetase beta subunit